MSYLSISLVTEYFKQVLRIREYCTILSVLDFRSFSRVETFKISIFECFVLEMLLITTSISISPFELCSNFSQLSSMYLNLVSATVLPAVPGQGLLTQSLTSLVAFILISYSTHRCYYFLYSLSIAQWMGLNVILR